MKFLLHLVRFLAVLVFAPAAVSAQDSAASAMVGCYALALGPWTPELGSNAQFHVPPDSIRLEIGSDPYRAGWRRAGPTIQHPYASKHAWASWQPTNRRGFRVVWSDGFTGADLILFPRPDGMYRGVIVAVSDRKDESAPVPRAAVDARRVTCSP